MRFSSFLRQNAKLSVLKIVAPQDGGWSLMPMEHLLRGLRDHSDMLSLEMSGVNGVVSYGVRSQRGEILGGTFHSYFTQAKVSHHFQGVDEDVDRKDWLHISGSDLALVQTLSLAHESYLPLRIFDDRTIEQSKTDPLAGVIGLLASCTQSSDAQSGERLGVRLVIRPAEEDWNAPWQDMMQQRRDGDDRTPKPGTGKMDSGPSMGTMLAVGGFLALAAGNYLLWDAGNVPGMFAFNAAAVAAVAVGVGLAKKFGGGKKRAYMDEELVEAKLKSLAFWSELQIIRVYNSIADRDIAYSNLEQIVDCLRSFDDPAGNSWQVGKVREYTGQDVVQLTHKDHPFVSWDRFAEGKNEDTKKKEMAVGTQVLSWIDPKRATRTALSAREVASLWHPPLGADEMASMDRVAGGVRVPFLADLTIGEDNEDAGPKVGLADDGRREIYLPESSIRKHALILGRSGVGKSTMIKHIIHHKLQRKAAGKDNGAIVVIDPHADLVRDILTMVPPSIAHKIRLLDFGRSDRVPGINLVDPYLFTDRDRCVDTIIETVKHLWDHWGGRLEDLLKRSLTIVYEYNCHDKTERHEMLTMLDILALLDDGKQVGSGRDARTVMSAFQEEIMSRVTDPALKQWFDAYLGWDRSLRAEATGPVHSRIGAYIANQRASVIMGQRESTINLSNVLSDGLVLLVSTAQGTVGVGPAALMGGTMVSLVESALRDQESIEQKDRAKCLLVCDEFQTVTGANWEGLLAEIRKYGCSLMLATQSLARLDSPERKLKAGILGNVGCIVGYQMSAEDARIISPEMDSERIEERFLVNLDPHHCYVRINSETKCYPAFSMKTLAPPDHVEGFEKSIEAVMDASVDYTVDMVEARARLQKDLQDKLDRMKLGSDEGDTKPSNFGGVDTNKLGTGVQKPPNRPGGDPLDRMAGGKGEPRRGRDSFMPTSDGEKVEVSGGLVVREALSGEILKGDEEHRELVGAVASGSVSGDVEGGAPAVRPTGPVVEPVSAPEGGGRRRVIEAEVLAPVVPVSLRNPEERSGDPGEVLSKAVGGWTEKPDRSGPSGLGETSVGGGDHVGETVDAVALKEEVGPDEIPSVEGVLSEAGAGPRRVLEEAPLGPLNENERSSVGAAPFEAVSGLPETLAGGEPGVAAAAAVVDSPSPVVRVVEEPVVEVAASRGLDAGMVEAQVSSDGRALLETGEVGDGAGGKMVLHGLAGPFELGEAPRSVRENPLGGIPRVDVTNSPFTPSVLEGIILHSEDDEALRKAIDRRLGGHITRERRLAREQETGRIREEVGQAVRREYEETEMEIQQKRESMERERASLDSLIAAEREKIREEERKIARRELGRGYSDETEARDPERLIHFN